MQKEPDFRTKPAFKIVGVERYTDIGIPRIREAWSEFTKRSEEIGHTSGPVAYGIEDYSRDLDMNNGGFPKYYYIAGLEVDQIADVPKGMTGKEIPQANYAVFTFEGPVDRLHEFYGHIYGQWLPSSGYEMDPDLHLDFERYPERLMDMNRARLEIWVPIVKADANSKHQ